MLIVNAWCKVNIWTDFWKHWMPQTYFWGFILFTHFDWVCLLSNYSQCLCCMLHSTASLSDCHIESFSATLWCCECEQCYCARCCPTVSRQNTFHVWPQLLWHQEQCSIKLFFCIHFKNYPYTIPVSYKQQGIYLMKPLHNNLKCASKCCIFPYSEYSNNKN